MFSFLFLSIICSNNSYAELRPFRPFRPIRPLPEKEIQTEDMEATILPQAREIPKYQPTVNFKIPLNLRNMCKKIKDLYLRCGILYKEMSVPSGLYLGSGYSQKIHLDADGNFNQIVTVPVKLSKDIKPDAGKYYECRLYGTFVDNPSLMDLYQFGSSIRGCRVDKTQGFNLIVNGDY